MKSYAYITVLFVFVFMGGCAETKPPMKPIASPAKIETITPPSAELKALPAEQLETVKREPEVRFSMSLRNTDIREFLAALAKQTGLNIIPSPEIVGKVTLDLKKVTLSEALESVLKPLGYDWREENSFIYAFKSELETRIFKVDYISTIRSGSSSISTVGGAGGAAAGAGLTGGGGGAVASSDTANFFAELEKGLASLLSGQGKLSVNPLGGMITVTDFPANTEKIANYLKMFQEVAHRQVLIQATIVEVTLSEEYQYGINWSLLSSASTLGLKGAAEGGKVLTQSLGTGSTLFQFGVSDRDISFVLDAMSKQGEVRVLSNPKVSTLNNQKAIMRVGTQDIFFEITREKRAEAQGEEFITTTARVIPVGITLDVTPQISEDGVITLSIHPSITERTGEAKSRLGDIFPILGVRETQTVIRVKDGETIVIGGLIGTKVIKETTSVPGLKDIPLLGPLFKSPKETEQRTEVVILLTPRIMESGKVEEITRREVGKTKKIRENFPRESLYPKE